MGRDLLPFYPGSPHPVYGIVDFVGAAFVHGLAGGAAFHFVKGLRGSPIGGRLACGVRAACRNAPRVAGMTGAYCVAYSAMESAVFLARGSDETWGGASAAAAATFGLDGLRRGGAPAAARGALIGATSVVVLAELYRANNVSEHRKSLLRQKRKNGSKPAPVALLRPKPDGSGESAHRLPSWLRMSSSRLRAQGLVFS